MSRVLNLNNSKNIIADSVFLIQGDDLININDLFLTKDEGSDIVGLPPDTLNTLQEIANAIGNDSDFFNTINAELNLKRNIADSYDKTYIDNLISNYYTKSEINSSLALKLDASVINSYYDKTYVDNLISGYYTKTEANTLLNLKANSSDVYATTQTDDLLALKANQSTTYTKSEVDTSLNLKANQSTTYTKTETDTLLNSKANQATTYTKSEVDTALLTKVDLTTYNTEKVLKADISNVYYKNVLYTKTEVNTLLGNKFNSSDISNYYTKTEIDTTFGLYYNKIYIDTLISDYYNKSYIDGQISTINTNINTKLNANAINDYYTKVEVDTQFSNLIDSAPDALNTLKELADALNNDANYATTVQNQLATKRNISDSYNKSDVDALVDAPQHTVYTASLSFQDVDSLGIDTLSIKGGNYITIIDALNNSLLDLDTAEVQIHPPLHCISTATFSSDITAPNIYTKTETNALLGQKAYQSDVYTKAQADGRFLSSQAPDDAVLPINGGFTGIALGTANNELLMFLTTAGITTSIDISAPNISALADAVSANALGLDLKADADSVYTKVESDARYALVGAPATLGQINTPTDQAWLLINGGSSGLQLRNSAGDMLLMISGAGATFSGDVSAPNIATLAADVATKQPELGVGNPSVPHTKILSGNIVKSLTSSNGISINQVGDTHLNISAETLEQSIALKANAVDVYLANLALEQSITNVYTKSESDSRYLPAAAEGDSVLLLDGGTQGIALRSSDGILLLQATTSGITSFLDINTPNINNLATAVGQNSVAIDLKANSADVYTISQTDQLLTAKQDQLSSTITGSEYTEILSGASQLKPLRQGAGISVATEIDVSTGSAVEQGIQIALASEYQNLPSRVSTAENQIAAKQNILNNVDGTGEPLLESDFVKRIFTVSPLNIKTYFNFNDSNDPKNANIELKLDATADLSCSTLNVSTGVNLNHPTSSQLVANKNLTLGQTGDQYGATYLHIRNRTGENGAIFESTDPTITLVDFIFKTAAAQRNIRMEGRSNGRCGANSWHIGGANINNPTLAVGDTRAGFNTNVSIGTYASSWHRLYVSGNAYVTGTSYATSHTNLSDQSIKDEIQEASEQECMDLLRAVVPKTYIRTDMDTSNRRLGFVAQDLSASVPTEFANICGEFRDDVNPVDVNSDGTNNDDPIHARTLQTVDYARLSAVLWAVCRNLDARVQALEATV